MDTVANAFRLSLFFGEDKVLKHQGLEQSWKDLETKLASGYPALFYGRIPYLPIYAAAGVHIQFGCLWPHGQVPVLLHGSCILVAVLYFTLTAEAALCQSVRTVLSLSCHSACSAGNLLICLPGNPLNCELTKSVACQAACLSWAWQACQVTPATLIEWVD